MNVVVVHGGKGGRGVLLIKYMLYIRIMLSHGMGILDFIFSVIHGSTDRYSSISKDKF